MSIAKRFQQVVDYVSEAVGRIFGPNDDQYPATGEQPFSGDFPNRRRRRRREEP